ncbi:MAG: nucleotide-binding protein [Clostridia bacterium]|nr:nucleotide-binding protein [Clostridia bacterium]
MKPKVFIGSSVEGLEIANAIQAQLDYYCEATVWKDGIFKLSENALESLEKTLNNMEYGIFVFSDDDVSKIRDIENPTVRDNVLFEFGLFMGKLGREKVFFIVPENVKDLHLPTDLLGITTGTYFERDDGNLISGVNTFCENVKKIIASFNLNNYGLIKYGMFQDFASDISLALKQSENVTLYFIHSRSWRENNHNAIIDFLRNEKSKKLTVFLPDFLNESLMNSFKDNFSDGKYIPNLIEDAVKFFLELKSDYPDKIDIHLYAFYPTYSFYMFDKTTIIALYPTTDRKKNVPTFMINNTSGFYRFVADDCLVLKEVSIDMSESHLSKIKED